MLTPAFPRVSLQKTPTKNCSDLLEAVLFLFLFHRIGHQGDGTGALDGLAQLTLMLGTVAAHPAGQDLATLVGEAAQAIDILVIDEFNLIDTEGADLPAGTTSSAGARSSTFTATRRASRGSMAR